MEGGKTISVNEFRDFRFVLIRAFDAIAYCRGRIFSAPHMAAWLQTRSNVPRDEIAPTSLQIIGTIAAAPRDNGLPLVG